jgi:hypothetical protein
VYIRVDSIQVAMMGLKLLILLWGHHLFVTLIQSTPCAENEILLHNRTCHCPFFRFNDRCMRKRYQTTMNTTLERLQAARHLLGIEPVLLTIDASNHEAMRALAESLEPLFSAGTVVTTVVDAMDVLVGGEPSATMEIVNASVSGTLLTLTVEYRLPAVD